MNLTAAFRFMRAALPVMIPQRCGAIVNIASNDASFTTGALVPVDGGTSAQ